LTGIYDDRILSFTNEWISTNALCSKVKGDRTGIIPAIKSLMDRNYVEMRRMGNQILYRRIDKAQTQVDFDQLMELFESNKLIAIDEMNEIKPVTIEGIFTKEGITLLDWVQSELLDRAFMVMSRIKYQGALKLLPHSVVNKRLARIDEFVDSVMKLLEPLNEKKLILERFQNHTHTLEPFKI
jgi:hypothetical protein